MAALLVVDVTIWSGRLPRSGEVIVSGGRETSIYAPREQREK